MIGTVVFRGVPNQQESASRSASAAVSVGSSLHPWSCARHTRTGTVRGGPGRAGRIGFGDRHSRALIPPSCSSASGDRRCGACAGPLPCEVDVAASVWSRLSLRLDDDRFS